MGMLGVVVWLAFGIPFAIISIVTSSPFLMVAVVALAFSGFCLRQHMKEREMQELSRFFHDGNAMF